MKTQIENITVWQALSLLGVSRDGERMTEEHARKALREIGMKESEMDEPYPEEGMAELMHFIESPDCLNKEAKKARSWMISRN